MAILCIWLEIIPPSVIHIFSVDLGIKYLYYAACKSKVVVYLVHVHAFRLPREKLGGGIFHALFIGSIVQPDIVHNNHPTLIIPISVCYYSELHDATIV